MKKKRILAATLSAAMMLSSANIGFAEELDAQQFSGGGYFPIMQMPLKQRQA